MPSFAKKEGADAGVDSLVNIFAREQVKDVLQNMKNGARKRATEILQREIPEYIAHLNGLIEAGKTDESSPLWQGHLKTGPFVKENVKLVFKTSDKTDADARDEQRQGTPTIVIRGVDELSLTEVSTTNFSKVDEDLEVQGAVWKGGLTPNAACDRLMNLLEVESEKAINMGKELIHWVRLEIPTIEDGNNFGVDVQEEMIRRIESVCHGAMKAHTAPKGHYDDRMNLAQAWNKFPGLEDHAAAIASSDRFDFFLATMAMTGMRNSMVELLSHLCNNWAKVHNPKNADSAGAMY